MTRRRRGPSGGSTTAWCSSPRTAAHLALRRHRRLPGRHPGGRGRPPAPGRRRRCDGRRSRAAAGSWAVARDSPRPCWRWPRPCSWRRRPSPASAAAHRQQDQPAHPVRLRAPVRVQPADRSTPTNHAYIRSRTATQDVTRDAWSLRNGAFRRASLIAAITRAFPRFRGTVNAGGWGGEAIEADALGRLYTLVEIRVERRRPAQPPAVLDRRRTELAGGPPAVRPAQRLAGRAQRRHLRVRAPHRLEPAARPAAHRHVAAGRPVAGLPRLPHGPVRGAAVLRRRPPGPARARRRSPTAASA